jgi:hypothetical protein
MASRDGPSAEYTEVAEGTEGFLKREFSRVSKVRLALWRMVTAIAKA